MITNPFDRTFRPCVFHTLLCDRS